MGAARGHLEWGGSPGLSTSWVPPQSAMPSGPPEPPPLPRAPAGVSLTRFSALASLATAQNYEDVVKLLEDCSPISRLELCKCYFAIAKALGTDIDRINNFESIVGAV